jgi:hypothetical protein
MVGITTEMDFTGAEFLNRRRKPDHKIAENIKTDITSQLR